MKQQTLGPDFPRPIHETDPALLDAQRQKANDAIRLQSVIQTIKDLREDAMLPYKHDLDQLNARRATLELVNGYRSIVEAMEDARVRSLEAPDAEFVVWAIPMPKPGKGAPPKPWIRVGTPLEANDSANQEGGEVWEFGRWLNGVRLDAPVSRSPLHGDQPGQEAA